MNIHLSFSKHCWQYPRSSRPVVFCKKNVFKSLRTKGFSCEFCNIFKNTFFHRTAPVAASENLKAEAVVWRRSVKKLFFEILLNSQENTCARVSFLQPKECNFTKIESLTQAFSCEFWEHLSKNTFFTDLLVAPVKACNFTNTRLHRRVFLWTF